MSALFRTFAQVLLHVFNPHLSEATGIGTKSIPSHRCGPIGATLQGATSLRDSQGKGGAPLPLQVRKTYDFGEMPPAEFAAQSPVILAIAG